MGVPPLHRDLLGGKNLHAFSLSSLCRVAPEIVWSNISWVDLNATATAVKSALPEAFVWYNEGGAPLWGNYNSQSALYPMLVVLAVWSLPVG